MDLLYNKLCDFDNLYSLEYKKPVANNEKKGILPNLTINKCILNSIIKHHNTNTQKYTK